MTDDRWTRIERIYHAALEQPACDRAAFVRREAEGDVEMVAEVEALLTYDERPAAFMQHSAMELAARALAAQPDRCEADAYSGTIGSYEIMGAFGRRRHGGRVPRARPQARAQRRTEGASTGPCRP